MDNTVINICIAALRIRVTEIEAERTLRGISGGCERVDAFYECIAILGTLKDKTDDESRNGENEQNSGAS